MSNEEIEILALRWARNNRLLNNRNVDCFIEAIHIVRDYFAHEFADFLAQEGNYYCNDYKERRIDSCAYSGQPITRQHQEEFNAAKELGELLLKASDLVRQHNILN